MSKNYETVDSVETLKSAFERVKEAQAKFAKYTQEQVDEIFKAAAMAANHKATKTIENVNIDDYELAIVKRTDGKKVRPQKAIIDGEEFDILRTYEKGQFNVEIVCEEVDM